MNKHPETLAVQGNGRMGGELSFSWKRASPPGLSHLGEFEQKRDMPEEG